MLSHNFVNLKYIFCFLCKILLWGLSDLITAAVINFFVRNKNESGKSKYFVTKKSSEVMALNTFNPCS